MASRFVIAIALLELFVLPDARSDDASAIMETSFDTANSETYVVNQPEPTTTNTAPADVVGPIPINGWPSSMSTRSDLSKQNGLQTGSRQQQQIDPACLNNGDIDPPDEGAADDEDDFEEDDPEERIRPAEQQSEKSTRPDSSIRSQNGYYVDDVNDDQQEDQDMEIGLITIAPSAEVAAVTPPRSTISSPGDNYRDDDDEGANSIYCDDESDDLEGDESLQSGFKTRTRSAEKPTEPPTRSTGAYSPSPDDFPGDDDEDYESEGDGEIQLGLKAITRPAEMPTEIPAPSTISYIPSPDGCRPDDEANDPDEDNSITILNPVIGSAATPTESSSPSGSRSAQTRSADGYYADNGVDELNEDGDIPPSAKPTPRPAENLPAGSPDSSNGAYLQLPNADLEDNPPEKDDTLRFGPKTRPQPAWKLREAPMRSNIARIVSAVGEYRADDTIEPETERDVGIPLKPARSAENPGE